MISLKQEAKAYAAEIGLDLVGVASPEPFERFVSELGSRTAHYQERYAHRIDSWKKMAHPQDVLPDAKAVLESLNRRSRSN